MNDLMQDDDNIEEELKMADKTDWIVEGFQFGTEQDANLAKNEKLRVERLEERLDYQSPEMVYAVYKKAVENRVFKTPVGYEFLKKLQRILKENPDFEYEVEEIPIQGVYSLRESANPTVERIKASQKKPKPAKKTIGLRASLFINVVLMLLIALMFYISMTSTNPTALNYERAVQNKYAEWERELSERESAVREKERELLLEECMGSLKILVVDDESRMRKLVKDFLVKQGYTVLEAGDGSEALDIFYENQDIALLILDIMMPKVDGWQVCREVRASSKVPIIMLTARGDERDELQGFELGVDEYIAKPFSPKILVARVEAILRRTSRAAESETLECGGIVIDKAAHVVTIDAKAIDLSYKEFELLTYFVENRGIALSREKILNSVWNYDYFGDARTIDTHVKKLRSKMGEKGELIKTVWGMGYKLDV